MTSWGIAVALSAGWPGRAGPMTADPGRSGSDRLDGLDVGGRLEQLPAPEVGLDLPLPIGAGQLDEL